MASQSIGANNINIPFFVENQILRADDLNALVRAIKRQLRQSRIFSVGVGIVNGLGIGQTGDGITISGGLAISSDGYMFDLQSCTLTHYRQIPLSKRAFGCLPNSREQCFSTEDLFVELIYELEDFSGDTGPPDGQGWEPISLLLDVENLDYTLVLLWCEEQVARQSCFNECEEKGADRFEKILKVLVPKSYFDEDVPQQDVPEGVEVKLPANPEIKRFGQSGTVIDFCEQASFSDFYNSYRAVCHQATSSINDALNQAYEYFYKQTSEGALNLFLNWGDIFSSSYPDAVPLNSCTDIQYAYSWLRELIAAYQEFKSVAQGLTILDKQDGEGLSECLFPGHVSLGIIGKIPVECRTGRILPEVFPEVQERLKLAECLYKRLESMTNTDNLLFSTLNKDDFPDIRITPDARRFRFLRRRALPFYYKTVVKGSWDCHEKTWPVLQYELQESNPLLCELEAHDFFRVEGHFGKGLTYALDKLDELRKDLNIPFDIQCVRIGPAPELEEEKDLHLGELNELYLNTRADILCKIDEMGPDNLPQEVPIIKFTLNQWLDLSKIPSPAEIESPNNCTGCPDIKIPDDLLKVFTDKYGEAAAATANNDSLPSLHPDLGGVIEDLYRKYLTRKIEIERHKSLPCFAKAHPGLEHLGGVSRGGTLVLGYVFKIKENERSFFIGYTGLESNSSDEALLKAAIAKASSLNNQLITIEDIRKKVIKTVTADFCLPYVCCSDSPVIRNEIRAIRPQIIGDNVFCFDDFSNPPTFGISPEGGILDVFLNDVKIDSISPAPLTWQPLDEDENLVVSPDDFTDYKATLKLVYYLGSEKVDKTIVIYTTPELNVWTAVKGEPCVNENCQSGYMYAIGPTAPISVIGLEKLVVKVGDMLYTIVGVNGPNLDLLIQDGDDEGKFGSIEHCVFFSEGVSEVQITVKNLPCEDDYSFNISPCDDLEIEMGVTKFIPPVDGQTPWQEEDISIEDNAVTISLTDPDPGFVELKPVPVGGNFEIIFTGSDPPPVVIQVPSQEFPCESRYFLIYNVENALLFLGPTNGGNVGDDYPLKQEMVDGLGTEIMLEVKTPLNVQYQVDYCDQKSFGFDLILDGVGDPPEPRPDPEEPEPIILARGASRPETPAPPTAQARAAFSARQAAYLQTLEGLQEDLGASKGFKLANLFLSTQGEQAKLTAQYLEAAKSLLLGQRAATDANRERLGQALATLTFSFMDKLAAMPGAASPEALGAIRETAQKMEEGGHSLASLRRQWKAAELKKVMDAAKVDLLNKQLK